MRGDLDEPPWTPTLPSSKGRDRESLASTLGAHQGGKGIGKTRQHVRREGGEVSRSSSAPVHVVSTNSNFPILPTPHGGEESSLSKSYVRLAALQSPVSTFATTLHQTAAAQTAQQQQLEAVLVPTATASDEVVTTFEYDGDGGRVRKTVSYPNDTDSDFVTIYVGRHYVCQGPTVESLACAKMIFAIGQRIAMVQVDHPTKTTFFHADHLGSTSLVTNEQGVVKQDYTYYPFGATNTQSGTAENDVHYKYTGQELDGSTHLYFYHARYYDPQIGRFISPDRRVPDPGNPQDFNRYSYVRNNPLLYVDPTGEFAVLPFILRAGYGAVVGATAGGLASSAQGASGYGVLGGIVSGFLVGGAVGLINPPAVHEAASAAGTITAVGLAGTANLISQYVGNLAGKAEVNATNGVPILQSRDFLSSAGFDLASFGGSLVGSPLAGKLTATTSGFLAARASELFGTKFTSDVAGTTIGNLTVGSLSTFLGQQFFPFPIVDFSNGLPPNVINPRYQGPPEPIFLNSPPFNIGQSGGNGFLGFDQNLNFLRFSNLFN